MTSCRPVRARVNTGFVFEQSSRENSKEEISWQRARDEVSDMLVVRLFQRISSLFSQGSLACSLQVLS